MANLGTDPFALQRSLSRLEAHLTSVTGADSPGLRLVGLELLRAVKLKLSHPGTGIIYQRGKHKHQASAPGEPPAPDSGVLRNSMDMGTVGGVLRVGTGVEYAPMQEFGTIQDGGYIAERPFMRPALAEVRGKMSEVLKSFLRGEVRRGKF